MTGVGRLGRRPHLLLVASGMRHFREYLLASIAGSYRVHLMTSTTPTWEVPYLDGWSLVPTTLQHLPMVAAARALHRSDPLDGVLCWDEARILPASRVAAALGLPGSTPEAVERCRDKHLTREVLGEAGVPQPRSVLVGNVEEALQAAQELGFPVVLKPRALAASLGVVLVRDVTELRARWSFARDTTVPEAQDYAVSVLVEEYAAGPEVSVDCAVLHGRTTPFCLAHKQIGFSPYFEEVGHEVRGDDPLLRDPELVALLDATHRTLEFTDGMTHVELRLTDRGPRVIEVNARIGGDLIPYLGLRTTGVDPGLVAAAIACGGEPDLAADRSLCGAVRFEYVPERTSLESVRFDRTAMPAAVDRIVVLAEPGRSYAPPPEGTLWGRIAYATAVAATVAECRTAVSAASRGMHVERVRRREPKVEAT